MNAVTDRRAHGYQPHFDIDHAFGLRGEKFAGEILQSIYEQSIEVKNDARYKDTGNLFVEYQCRRRGVWHKSGIAVTTAQFWCFVLDSGHVAVFIDTEWLLRACRSQWSDGNHVEMQKGSHPTKGVLLPLNWLLREFEVAA